MVVFADRRDAGRRLAAALARHAAVGPQAAAEGGAARAPASGVPRGVADAVVLALPRGGVIVACEVARALALPLDLAIARKVGHPRWPEFAVAAVSEGGELIVDPVEVDRLNPAEFARAVALQRAEAERRRWLYLGDAPRSVLTDKTTIVVDDGVATGLTMRAALRDVRARAAARIVVAVPVASSDAVALLAQEADDLLVLVPPEAFAGAVGAHYRNFAQVGDDQVIAALAAFRAEAPLTP